MRKILSTFTTLGAIALLSLASCSKDDTLYSGNVTMGNIDGETIVSDQGNTFDIAESMFEVTLSDYKYGRVMLACDILKETADKRYDIRLLAISQVLTKEAVKASTITPESELAVEDAIVIRDMWYSGGYLNMLIEFAYKQGSETSHFINLVYDDVTAAETDSDLKSYTFTLRHNAYGETPKIGETYLNSTGYVSFPIASIIKEDKAELNIRWKSHRFMDGEYKLYETEDMEHKGEWIRSGFEHPATALKASPSFRAMIQ